MANNRYFIKCSCGEQFYLSKSLGDGMYRGDAPFPDGSMHKWMWEHLMDCPHPAAKINPLLGPEWAAGEIFKIVTEYDPK